MGCYESKCNQGAKQADIKPEDVLKNQPKDEKSFNQKLFIQDLSDKGEQVEIMICGKALHGTLYEGYTHHLLLAKCIETKKSGSDIYITFDWMEPTDKYPTSFRQTILKRDDTFLCQKVPGIWELYVVKQKCQEVSRGKKYDTRNYNCSHWASEVYEKLTGKKITLKDDCKCARNPSNSIGLINKGF